MKSVKLGESLAAKTTIELGENAFANAPTTNIDLILGENVLPEPDLAAKTWNGYTWKSITDAAPTTYEVVLV